MAHDFSSAFLPPRGPDEIGRLGRYRLLRVCGEGTMGMVFEAEDLQRGGAVAVKVIQPSLLEEGNHRQRFHREAALTQRLDHPHVIGVLDVGEENGVPFLVMPLLRGETLEARLQRAGRLPVAEVARIGAETADGLAAAHEHGLIHRDIKPANIWLEAAADAVKVLDFGLARPAQSATGLTRTGDLVGTPFYMAPEMAEHQRADASSDLFSLGCVLYQMSTGHRPFTGEHLAALLIALTEEDPPPPHEVCPDVPQPLSRLILQMLSKKPARRPASAAAVRDRLRELASDPTAEGPDDHLALPSTLTALPGNLPPRPPEPARAPPRRAAGRGLAFLAGCLAATLVLGLLWLRAESARRESPATLDAAANLREDLQRLETAHDRLRRLGYIRGVNLAQRDWEAGLVFSAREALENHPPDLHGWEWHYVHTLCRPQPLTLPHTRGGSVYSVAFSPDGLSLAVGYYRGAIKLWDARTGREQRTLAEHTNCVASLAFSPDGKRLVSSSWDDTVKIWDVNNGAVLTRLSRGTLSYAVVVFSPDGKQIASAWSGNQVMLLASDGKEVRKLQGHGGRVTGLAFSPDGRLLAGNFRDQQLAVVWDVGSGKPTRLKGHDGTVWSLTFSPDGKRLATGSFDLTIKVWDVQTGEVVRSLTGHTSTITCLSFSPDGKRLASGCWKGDIKLWDAERGDDLLTLLAHHGKVERLRFSPDGAVLASSSVDRTVKLWPARPPSAELRKQRQLVWRQQQARQSEEGKAWTAAAFHLTRLLESEPRNPRLYRRRAAAREALGQAEEARQDVARAAALETK